MSDDTAQLRSQLRDAETKVRVAESALKDARSRTLRWSAWSAAGGFLVFALGGQWFPGYQLDSTARAASARMVADAVSEGTAHLCADRFLRESGLASRLETYDAVSGDWDQTKHIREGAWSSMPDGQSVDHATASQCRELIAEGRLAATAAATAEATTAEATIGEARAESSTQ